MLCTPCIHHRSTVFFIFSTVFRLCNAFNDGLGLILDDAAYFINNSRNEKEKKNRSGSQSNITKASEVLSL